MQNLSVCITIFFIILILTNQQFDKGTIIKLSKMPSIAKLLSSSNPNNPSIVLGFADGQIRFIESSTNRTISTSKMHDTQIKHIQVNYKSNIIFIANKTSVTIYNTNYLIEKTINFQKEILGLSVAEEDDGRGFFSLHFQTRIMEEQYTIFLDKKINAAFLVIILGEEGASNVKYSKDHKYLYVINKTRSQFNIFNAENPQQIITTEVINNTNKYENNQPQKALLQLTRKFNFNIKWMIIDNKNHKDLNNKMIFVSDENTIFYADQGNIITYIPYSTYNDELIGVDFCQSNYIAILYKHVVHGEPYFYLNLVFKDNAHSYKTISLNDIFGQIESIKQIDCNYNMIIFITGRKELLILKGQQIFDYKYYIKLQNIGLFFLILSFFLKDKDNEDDKISLKDTQKVYQKEYEQSQQVSTSENSENNNKVSRNK